MRKILVLTVLFLLVFILNSCLQNNKPGLPSASGVLPNVTGSAGQILLVLDNTLWKGEIGNLFKEILEQEYPSLPQPEPLFDVIHISPGAFDNMFKTHRSVILLNISSQDTSAKIKYTENNWAKPQIVVNINAPDNQTAIKIIRENKDKLVYTLLTYDRKRIADVYKSGKDLTIKNILAKFHVNLAVPRGYNVDVNTNEFVLLSIESARSSQNLIIYRYPYLGPTSLLSDNLIEMRNQFLKRYTVGTRVDSYMTTAKLFTPIVYDLTKGDRNYVEIRGLWELHNGFMGGPFISHSTVNEATKEVITVEGYVYNPGEKKRNLMRQLEAVVYSFEIIR